jgi:nicotinamidase-related amidase
LAGLGEEVQKVTFGSLELAQHISLINKEQRIDEIEIVGLVSSICVISNALILKAALPETKVSVPRDCTAGISKEDNDAAFIVMKCCQLSV